MPRISRLGLLLALAGVLLAVSPALYEPFVITKLAVLSAGLLAAWIGLFRTRLRATAFDGPLAALWAVLLASAAASGDRPVSLLGRYPQLFYGLLPLGLCTALYYAVAATSDEALIDELLAALLAASIPLSLYGVVQRLGLDPILRLPLPDFRVISTIGNPVMLGAVLVALAPLALHWTLEKKSGLGRVAGGLVAVALLLTWSRGAWLSAAAAVALYLQLTGRLRANHRHLLGIAVGLPVFYFASRVALGKLQSDAMRVELLKSAWPMFAAHPLLGWGPDNFLAAFQAHKTDGFLRAAKAALVAHPNAHDDLLQAAVTLGLSGLLAYLWLNWALFVRLRARLSAPKPDARDAALAAALAGLCLQAKVNPIPLSALALAAALLGAVGRRKEAPELGAAAGRAACLAAVLFCAGSAAFWARCYAADGDFRDGGLLIGSSRLPEKPFMDGVGALRRANELNPWIIDYARQRCDVIFQVAAFVSPEQGRQLVDKALTIADEAVRLHPGNSSAHQLRATALELKTRFGVDRLPEALAETETALAQDPSSLFALRRRMEIARALHDQAAFDAALARYRHVLSLTGEDAAWEPLLK